MIRPRQLLPMTPSEVPVGVAGSAVQLRESGFLEWRDIPDNAGDVRICLSSCIGAGNRRGSHHDSPRHGSLGTRWRDLPAIAGGSTSGTVNDSWARNRRPHGSQQPGVVQNMFSKLIKQAQGTRQNAPGAMTTVDFLGRIQQQMACRCDPPRVPDWASRVNGGDETI